MVSCVLRLLGILAAVRAEMLVKPFVNPWAPYSTQSFCLDLPGGDAFNGALLWLWDCYGGETQKWMFQNGQLVYAADASKCVDLLGNDSTNGNQLGLWDCNGGESQKWFYEMDHGDRWKLGTKLAISPGVWNSGSCAQFPDPSSMKAGDPVEIWDCEYDGNNQDRSSRQQWRFEFPVSEFVLPSSDFPTPIYMPHQKPGNVCIQRSQSDSLFNPIPNMGMHDCWKDDTSSIPASSLWHWVGNQFVSVMDGQCLGVRDNWENDPRGFGQVIDRNCSEDLTTWVFDADSGAIQLASSTTKCLGSNRPFHDPTSTLPMIAGLFDCDGSDLQVWRFRAPEISVADVMV